MALEQRRPDTVVHRSDQGTQSTSFAFGYRCRAEGVQPSVGTVGDCDDNAMCERFFSTLECELIDRMDFSTKAEAKREAGVLRLHRRLVQSVSHPLRPRLLVSHQLRKKEPNAPRRMTLSRCP
jgi:transposase InsO family protein